LTSCLNPLSLPGYGVSGISTPFARQQTSGHVTAASRHLWSSDNNA